MTTVKSADAIVDQIQREFGNVKFPILHGDNEQIARLITRVQELSARPTRAELLDMLTTAATVGRNEGAEAQTRGDLTDLVERHLASRIDALLEGV